ncbi:hypothetical protein LSPH26S_04271 [Lysinibacillus sphaericus]
MATTKVNRKHNQIAVIIVLFLSSFIAPFISISHSRVLYRPIYSLLSRRIIELGRFINLEKKKKRLVTPHYYY